MIIPPTNLEEQARFVIHHLHILRDILRQKHDGLWYCEWELDQIDNAIMLVERILEEDE